MRSLLPYEEAVAGIREGKVAPLYVLAGPLWLPVRAIKEALLEGLPEESRSLVWFRLGEGAPWQEAEEALRMPSFSGEKRCV
ncbi:MAG: hypothetical protein QJR00_04395, partial [Bacillota bacterium]|nr:hypothetical protein [Bacillota bacterium]